MQTGEDKIEKVIEFNVPVARVWRALTDAEEFGQWFRVELDGPFEEGRRSTGKMTYPGYEHYPWVATVERMEHEKLFSFRWH
ncbi:MAG: SRPBCC domain-containing protein, partial [Pseudomonadota bacterium]